jgi:hypothetical protein
MERMQAQRTSFVREFHPHRDLFLHFTMEDLHARLHSATTLEARQEIGKAVVEFYFEREREQLDPRLPSRLNCVYVCATHEQATIWQREVLPETVIYSCTVRGWFFVGDANKIGEARIHLDPAAPSLVAVAHAIEQIKHVAQSYWKSELGNPRLLEILVDGNVALGNRVPPVAV